MKDKKMMIVSVFVGIYLSLVFHISIRFPPIVSNLPLATGTEMSWNLIAVILDHMRIAFDPGYGIEQSVVAILFAFAFCKIYDIFFWCLDKYRWSIIVLSIFFGCINVLGLSMYWLECLPMFSDPIWLLGSIFLIIGWAMFFLGIASLFLYVADKKMLTDRKIGQCETRKIYVWIDKHLFFFSVCAILLVWGLWMLSYYPASMDNDVFAQLYAFMYEPHNHHPWFSSCVLGICYKIGEKINNDNLGIFIYVMGRNMILACIYAKCVVLQKEMGLKRTVYYLTLLFWAVTPVWGAYAKHAFKDTFTTGLFCLYIMTLIMMIYRITNNSLNFKICILHGAATLFVSLFRNNCIYAVLPAAALLIIFMFRVRQEKKYILIIFISVMSYFGYNHYIFNYGGVRQGSFREAMSIPFQQTARTVKYHKDELTKEELDGISRLFRYEDLPEAYNPILSDPVKFGCTLPDETRMPDDISKYMKTWMKMFFRYPVTYIEAAVGQSYGYYSFTPNLPEGSGNMNSGMTVFDWIGCDSGFDGNFQFHYIEKLSVPRQILHVWVKVWDKIPILCLTDVCAFYTWSIVLIFYYVLTKRRYRFLIPLVSVGFMILTCIASPVNDCFRYFSPVAAAYPVLFVLLMDKSVVIEKIRPNKTVMEQTDTAL